MMTQKLFQHESFDTEEGVFKGDARALAGTPAAVAFTAALVAAALAGAQVGDMVD